MHYELRSLRYVIIKLSEGSDNDVINVIIIWDPIDIEYMQIRIIRFYDEDSLYWIIMLNIRICITNSM